MEALGRVPGGTNLRAWLLTILRNSFLSDLRRRRDELSLDSEAAARLGTAAEQHGWMDGKDFLKALAQLTPEQREALILVGAEGFRYEEVAQLCGCPVGTVKSRVNRARVHLTELLGDRSDDGSAENAGVSLPPRVLDKR